ncbi:delta-60 repeat domain-containing protein [uncultured Porphyromonas sp.]|uniref:delta-60 repeat domain-containing protein n=1 Tax=uncultured Porphyromonas sp. TaxID=159274 RepID=UPI0026295CFA|nr:delta-60 repeat domain-containing protein [uncultured Porphyromonas sp.]
MKKLLYIFLFLSCCLGLPLSVMAQESLQNGQVDTSFRPILDSNPQAVIPLADGRVVVAGTFEHVGGRNVAGVMRLNADGSADDTFNVGGTGVDGVVTNIALQSDGKILVIGVFTTYNGTPVGQIIRLNEDGSLDTTFKNDNTLRLDASAYEGQYQWDLQPNKLLVSPDDSFYVLGGFNRVNGKLAPLIARFTAAGVRDESFLPTDQEIYFKSSPYIDAALLLPSGDIYFGGMINGYNGSSLNKKLFHIDAHGQYDESFAKPKFDFGGPRALAMKGADTLLVAGSFYESFGRKTPLMTALHLDGTPIEDFTVYDFSTPDAEDMINGLIVTDHYIIIGGGDIQMPKRSFVYALDKSGAALTMDFDFGSGPNQIVSGLTYDPAGWLYVSGFFTEFGGASTRYFARCKLGESDLHVETPSFAMPAVRVAVGEGSFSLYDLEEPAEVSLYSSDGVLCASYPRVAEGASVSYELPEGLYLMVVKQTMGQQQFKVQL